MRAVTARCNGSISNRSGHTAPGFHTAGLQNIMRFLAGAGLLPMPIEQPLHAEVKTAGDDNERLQDIQRLAHPRAPTKANDPPARPPLPVPPPPRPCLVRTGPPRKGGSSAVSRKPQAPPRPAPGGSSRRPLCQEPRCRGLHDRCCFPFPGTPSLGIRSDTLGQATITPTTGCSKGQAAGSRSPSTSEGLSAAGRAIVHRQAAQHPPSEPAQRRPRPLAFRLRPAILYRRKKGCPVFDPALR